ncbi:MAG: hypothetical protein R6V03_08955 [Kiritimatiellia bacterium]
MEYKLDFEEIVPRLEAFWRGEFLDRPCMDICAPADKQRDIPVPKDLQQQWTDIGFVIAAQEARMESTYFAGEAVPFFRPNLGPDLFSALMGSELEYAETTSWIRPGLDWNNPLPFEIHEDCFEWRWHMEIYDRLKERAPGRYLVTVPDCHSGGDALMSMRGGSNLCLDIYDYPEEIKAAVKQMEKVLYRFNEAFRKRVEEMGQNGHVTSWLRAWSPVYSTPVQLDLLALISPQMFRDFFLDEVKLQCSIPDNAIFHLDGPDAVKHLDIICELPINAVQWVPGAGNGPMTKWLDLLKEIQARGKGLYIGCSRDELEIILKELSSNGLYICTGAESARQADELLRLGVRLAHK